MSEQVTVDNLELARSGKSLAGSFPLAILSRLHDQVASLDATLSYELSGRLDSEGKPGLHCRVRGTLQLVCQRCLQPLTWELDLASDLVLVGSEAELAEGKDDPEAPDRLLMEKEMDVKALIEDEVLLGMPLVPRHPEGQCQAAQSGARREGEHPFAVLARLRPQT
jgi:uncharacterized protein